MFRFRSLAPYLFTLALLAAAVVLLQKKTQPPLHAPAAQALLAATPAPAASPGLQGEDVFRILDAATGEIRTVSAEEFLPGAVATEMTLYMHEEALKAQAVAAYTHYAWQREQHKDRDYDFTCDTARWQVYVSSKEMQERWGDGYAAAMETLRRVTEETLGLCLTYGDAPICATYFAISSGHTENAADVWSGDLPCVAAVASPWDAYADGYQSEASFSPEQLAEAVGCTLPEDPAAMVQVLSRSGSGGVTAVQVGEKTLTGGELRTALGLRSANFTPVYADGQWVFSVKGWGHGVGMSQVGADYLGAHGFTFEEILAWYYPGAVLSRLY